MVRKYMLIAGLVSLIVLGASLAGECETSLTSVRKWDFEDGKIGMWGKYGIKQPLVFDTTTEALSGKYSLNVKFDDTPIHEGASSFDKGVVVTINPALSWKEFNSISFRYLIEGEVASIRVILKEIVENGKGNCMYSADLPVTIGKPAEFCINTDELHFGYSSNKADPGRPIGKPMTTGKVTYMYISVHNKKPVNSGLKFSLTLDDIVLGKEAISFVSIMSSDVSHSPIAIAARTREPILIDGKLDDWCGAVPVVMAYENQLTRCSPTRWKGLSDLSAVAMVLWDSEYLYYAINVQDDKIICTNPDYTSSSNDCIRFFVRTSEIPSEGQDLLGMQDHAFYVFPFGPNQKKPILAYPRYYDKGSSKEKGLYKKFPLESVQIASLRTSYGYIIEMAVPWQALKITPKEGQRMGFFTFVDDSDAPGSWNREIVCWKVKGNFWHDASCWGELLLTKALTNTEAISLAAKTGSLLPASDKLEYERNQDVTCSLDFWRPLSPTDITGKVINVKTEKIAGDPLSFSTRTTPLSTQLLAKWNTRVTEDGIYAVSCKLGKEEPISAIGAHFKLIGLSVEKHREEIALSKINLDNLQSQLKRKDFRYPSSWIDKSLERRINRVHTERVDPAKWSLADDPVTWEDLGGDFQGHAQGELSSGSLDLFYKHYDFGRCIATFSSYITRPDWKRHWEDVMQRKLLVYRIIGTSAGTIKELLVDYAKNRKLRKIMGRSFFGYEIGEQDGYYIGSVAHRYKPTSRKEAQKLFWDWTEQVNNIRAYHYLVATSALGYVHQYGAMDGYRMLGVETAQALPSDIMMWAFLRGAGKQYGLLTQNVISVFNRWGWRSYIGSHKGSRYNLRVCGPDKGTSVSLMKRLYYVTYMYGSAINGFESAYFFDEKDEEGYKKLSPVGKINVEAVKWCRKHNKDKGVQYAPIALLIDFTSGWLPPQHLYSSKRYRIWGNMDYERGDYQIDNFLRWIYPQYEECSYFRDERGYLTATPFGDKFDVLTSNIHQSVLDQYQAVCLLGELEMTPELAAKLKKFVADGGDLIVSAAQAKILGAEFCGVAVSDKTHRGHGGLSLSDQKVFEEKEYIYAEIAPKTAKVLAVSGDKLPLITAADSGKGRVIVITPDYWMTIRLKVDDTIPRDFLWEKSDDPDYNLLKAQKLELLKVQRYELLKVVQHVLGQYFNDLDFIKIQGPKIQYVVNLTEDNKRLVLTLVNNDREVDWEGTVSLKEGKIVSAKEWMKEKELSAGRSINVKVPKGDLRVIEIIADKPLFHPVNN